MRQKRNTRVDIWMRMKKIDEFFKEKELERNDETYFTLRKNE